jgi:probable rRNA maturation factor
MTTSPPPLRHGLDVAALRAFLVAAGRECHLRGIVGVRLMDDASIRALNRDFRGQNHSTDVLSFPADSPQLGDLAISIETARRQARAHHHSLDIEVRILLLHGLLHLAGYDHERDQGQMRDLEAALRRRLFLPPGLIERHSGRKMKT